jgi:hypothetical protein
MRRNSPREATIPSLKSAIGRLVSTNISPTMRGKLLYYDSERSYFEVTKHESNDRYANCAGQIFLDTKLYGSYFKLFRGLEDIKEISYITV